MKETRLLIDVFVFEGGRSGFNTQGRICRLRRLGTVGAGGDGLLGTGGKDQRYENQTRSERHAGVACIPLPYGRSLISLMSFEIQITAIRLSSEEAQKSE